MQRIIWFLVGSVFLAVPTITLACTTIGFAGSYLLDGGTFVAKNRDAPIQGYQRLALRKPVGKHAYIVLAYGNDQSAATFPYVAGGTNEQGLTVLVNDPASHYPSGRNENAIETATVTRVLENYATVDAVRQDARELFGDNNPALFIVADAKKVANFEAGYDGKFSVKIESNGSVWALNQYHLPLTEADNKVITQDVKSRYQTLSTWLDAHQHRVVPGDAYRLLASHYHDEFNSISRSVTVAQYAVLTRAGETAQLRAKFTVPTQAYNEYNIPLTAEFFRNTPVGPLSDKTFGLLGSINMKKFDQFIKSIETAKPGSGNTF